MEMFVTASLKQICLFVLPRGSGTVKVHIIVLRIVADFKILAARARIAGNVFHVKSGLIAYPSCMSSCDSVRYLTKIFKSRFKDSSKCI